MCFACQPPCWNCVFGRVYEKNPKTGIDHPRDVVKTLCSECASMADPEDRPVPFGMTEEMRKLFSQKFLDNLSSALERNKSAFEDAIDPEIAAAKLKQQRERERRIRGRRYFLP